MGKMRKGNRLSVISDQGDQKERLLEVEGVKVRIEDKEVVKGVSLKIGRGESHSLQNGVPAEVVALMGPNGSGKSSLAKALMGSGGYEVVGGKIDFLGEDLLAMGMHERARRGLFLAWQNPPAIEGVKVFSLVKESLHARGVKVESMVELKKRLQTVLRRVGLSEEFWNREVNVGMSGGEKKRLLLALMLMLEPKLVILDEIDSGLDIDSLKVAGEVVREMREKGVGFLVITHYGRFLEYVEVDRVVVMREGKVVRRGGREVVGEIEEKGFGD